MTPEPSYENLPKTFLPRMISLTMPDIISRGNVRRTTKEIGRNR